MQKNTIVTLALLLAASAACGQFHERKNMAYKGASYDVFTVKLDTAVLKKFSIDENKQQLNEADYFATKKAASPLFFAITAAIIDSTCSPLGLYINGQQTLKGLNQQQGNGNFYLLPNGFIGIHAKAATVAESGVYQVADAYQMAIQSGPMLISKGSIYPKFSPTSQNKNIRCGVGTYTQKNEQYLVFVKSQEPVSFYQFAELFRSKLKCQDALNLESGANCSMHLPNNPVQGSTTVTVCNYIVVAL